MWSLQQKLLERLDFLQNLHTRTKQPDYLQMVELLLDIDILDDFGGHSQTNININ